MRRAEFLIPFSRDHHTTLKLARHLRSLPSGQALPGSLLEEYRQQQAALLAHFEAEESQLLPLLQQADNPALREQFEREHRELRQLLAAPPETETLGQLAEGLEQHIRFEERTLFPALEMLQTAASRTSGG